MMNLCKESVKGSARLDYRAIYIIDKAGQMEIVEIIEVNKHDY